MIWVIIVSTVVIAIVITMRQGLPVVPPGLELTTEIKLTLISQKATYFSLIKAGIKGKREQVQKYLIS